jgi:hypothetical protein
VSLVISDTTPLNYLILIGQIEVLPQLFGRLIVPPAVIREMLHPKAPADGLGMGRDASCVGGGENAESGC